MLLFFLFMGRALSISMPEGILIYLILYFSFNLNTE